MKKEHPDQSIKVLLLDGQTVQALSVLHSLHNTGIYVTIFCETKISYGFTSHFPDKKVLCPRIKNNEDEFLIFLKKFLSENPQNIIIPLFDDSALFLDKHRVDLDSAGVLLAMPKSEIFQLAFNKSALMKFCSEYHFPHPATEILDGKNLKEAGDKIGFPSLIKPVISSGAKGIVYLNSPIDLEDNYPKIEKQFGPAILQSYIDHDGYYYNAMLYRDKTGSFSKVVIIKIMRYFPVKGGTGSFSETVENQEIESLCKDILTKLDWYGFADFDIMTDKFTQKPYLIEINPRIPACIHASLVSGVNFPLMIIYDALGITLPSTPNHKSIKIRYLGMDILWFIFSNQRFRSKPSWFKFWGKDLYYQDGCNEFLPMIAGFLMGFRKYMSKEFRHAKLL